MSIKEDLVAPRKEASLNTSYHEKRLAQRLKDPEFRAQFDKASAQIVQIDSIIQTLEELREQAGISKADLARQIGKDPATVRRLFTARVRNPELRTVAALASALNAEIQIVPRSQTKSSNGRRLATA